MTTSPLSTGIDPLFWEILAYVDGAEQILRFSTHSFSTSPTDTPPNQYYNGAIVDAGSFSRSIFAGDALSGRASIDYGFIELANTGALDGLVDYGWGRDAILKSIPAANVPVAGAEVLLRCIVDGIETPDAPRSIRLRLRSRIDELDTVFIEDRYLGTTDSILATDQAEGDSSLLGKVKPRVYGGPTIVPGKLVNRFRLIYQFASNPVNSILVFDGGLELSQVGDFPTLAALISATVNPGECATCVAEGLARLGEEPAFKITATVIEGGSAIARAASNVLLRILEDAGVDLDTVNTDTFDALFDFDPAEVAIFVQDESTVIDVISQVADSVGAGIIVNDDNEYEVVFVDEPSTTVAASLNLRDLITTGSMQLASEPPVYSVIVNWGRIWETQSVGDLAPVISEATDGTNLEIKQRLGTEYLQAVATDEDVRTIHPRAKQLTFNTLLVNEVDAVAFAFRRLALFSVRRDRISFPVSFARDASAGNVTLGSSVNITMDRFGYGGTGKSFLVLGRKDDWKTKVRTLELWGPRS